MQILADPFREFVRQYLRALGRLYWELGRVVLHRCCSSTWSVLVLELRAMSPTVVRAALLGEQGGTTVTHCMGLFQMDPKGGAGEVSLPLLNQDGLAGSLRMHVQAPSQGVGTCRLQIYETNSQVEALSGAETPFSFTFFFSSINGNMPLNHHPNQYDCLG